MKLADMGEPSQLGHTRSLSETERGSVHPATARNQIVKRCLIRDTDGLGQPYAKFKHGHESLS
jgi:hypothetical protein